MNLEALGRYFYNLAASATNKKFSVEDLVANITTLTTTNVEILDMIKNITGKNWQLQQQLNSLKKKLSHNDLL